MNESIETENNNQNAKNHNKVKFCVRVLQLLNQTLIDRTKIKDIGLAWCEDGVHFICNTQILGNYIGLKANSINTNFRAHSFQIENIDILEIQKIFGYLPDIKNWKMRRNVSFDFTSESFEFEVQKIPCLEKNKRFLDISSTGSNSVLPPITFDLLRNDQSHLHQVELLMKKVDFMPNWKNKFLRNISKDWIELCQAINGPQLSFFESLCSSDLIDKIIDFAKPKISNDRDEDMIKDNLSHLFISSNCNSQSLAQVFFIDYLKLCLRFGSLNQIANSILELCSQITQKFVSWFIPSTDYNYAIDVMTRNSFKWCVKLSKTSPNIFSILVSSDKSAVQSSHIIFNPMPLKPDQKFFVKDEETSSIISRSSLSSFIQEVLNLALPLDIISTEEKKSITHVSYNNIAKSTSENIELSQKQLESQFLEFPDNFDLSNDFLPGSISPEVTLNFNSSQPNSLILNWS